MGDSAGVCRWRAIAVRPCGCTGNGEKDWKNPAKGSIDIHGWLVQIGILGAEIGLLLGSIRLNDFRLQKIGEYLRILAHAAKAIL